MIKSNGIISRVVRKVEVKDTNSVVNDVKRLERRFFLEAKEACAWESVLGLSGVHGVLKSRTYWPVKRVREAWVHLVMRRMHSLF